MTTPPTLRDKDIELETFVGGTVANLQRRYMADDAWAVRTMARLRRAVGTTVGADPDLWAVTLDDLPEALREADRFSRAERDGVATAWEQATHDAITLHAWHQQSRTQAMHQRGVGIGASVRRLGKSTDAEEAVRRRFHALGTASQHQQRLIYLRGLIGQLRASTIPLDYGRLARDLRRLQDRSTNQHVLLGWGRDYRREIPKDRSSELPTSAPEGEENP